MISFEQVLLLEEKVESAVKKIEQLNAENAALRAKCAELSNALSAKSEQFSSFESSQSKIEEGILKALNRLNAVENVVLSAGGAVQTPVSNSVNQNSHIVNSLTSEISEQSSSSIHQSEINQEKVFVNPSVVKSESVTKTDEPSLSSLEINSENPQVSDVDFEFDGGALSDNQTSQINQNSVENKVSAASNVDSSQQLSFDIF